MKIKEIPQTERPREKLLKYGKENLSDSELLAIILKTGSKGENVCNLSLKILNQIKTLENLKNINLETLTNIKGVGLAKGIELLALTELSKRIYYKQSITKKEKYNNPKTIYENNKYLFDNLKQEHFYCLYLNNNKQLIERKLLFMGTINKSIVHPREIFKEAYKLSASSIICMHNHPGGNKNPSLEDINLTKTLVKIGQINGIPVLDHLIITEDDYYSFYENNKEIIWKNYTGTINF